MVEAVGPPSPSSTPAEADFDARASERADDWLEAAQTQIPRRKKKKKKKKKKTTKKKNHGGASKKADRRMPTGRASALCLGALPICANTDLSAWRRLVGPELRREDARQSPRHRVSLSGTDSNTSM